MRAFRRITLGLGAVLLWYVAAIFFHHGLKSGWRVLAHRQPSVETHKIFPQRGISPSGKPLELKKNIRANFPRNIRFQYIGGESETNLADLFAATNTKAFIVLHKDEIVLEEYPAGGSRESVTTSFSVAKSFISTLIGIAVAEGKIRSIDDPVINYLPELKYRGLEATTVRDLMKMSSGIPYKQDGDMFPLWVPFSDDARAFYADDFRTLALSRTAGDEAPGKYFRYNDYNLMLEAILLERVTGTTVSNYMQEKLWQPAGMQFAASWSLDRENGLEHAHAGFNARPLDFARFGLLFLHNGNLNGKQIVPAAWVRQATEPDAGDKRVWKVFQRWQEIGGYYGLHWWGLKNADGSYDYMARGNLGQTIYVSPAKQAVVVRFGQGPRPDRIWPFAIRALVNKL